MLYIYIYIYIYIYSLGALLFLSFDSTENGTSFSAIILPVFYLLEYYNKVQKSQMTKLFHVPNIDSPDEGKYICGPGCCVLLH